MRPGTVQQTAFLTLIDYALLRQQKAWLVDQADLLNHFPSEQAHALGLVHLLDKLMDAAVEAGMGAMQVFGHLVPRTVHYREGEGELQAFECDAESVEHAFQQCHAAHPKAFIHDVQ